MYDFVNGKKRVDEILDNRLEVIEEDTIPIDNDFTFTNAYYGYVTGLFIDIRNSTDLFSSDEKIKVSKIIRSFTSETIEIVRDDNNLREIGIRGDCVYGIYTSPYKKNISEVFEKAIWINTYMKMLNKQLDKRNFLNIRAGIGISTAQELVVKAGRKGTGINNKVWIGKAVTMASNYSSIGGKNGYGSIVISKSTYDNIKDTYKDYLSYFKSYRTNENGIFYGTELFMKDFDLWIENNV